MDKYVFEEIMAMLFGRKYYANIVNTRGTDKCELAGFIFRTPGEAEAHRRRLAGNRSFLYVETITFRSRKEY